MWKSITMMWWEGHHGVVNCAAQGHKIRGFSVFKGIVRCFRSFSSFISSRAPSEQTLASLFIYCAPHISSHPCSWFFMHFGCYVLERIGFKALKLKISTLIPFLYFYILQIFKLYRFSSLEPCVFGVYVHFYEVMVSLWFDLGSL